jgi:hypothetical protein
MEYKYPLDNKIQFGSHSISNLSIRVVASTNQITIPSAELLDFLTRSVGADFFKLDLHQNVALDDRVTVYDHYGSVFDSFIWFYFDKYQLDVKFTR